LMKIETRMKKVDNFKNIKQLKKAITIQIEKQTSPS